MAPSHKVYLRWANDSDKSLLLQIVETDKILE